MMGLILIVLLFVLLLFATNPAPGERKTTKNENPFKDEIVSKNCPPHKWRYHEIKDEDGNVVRWKLACDLCGPLKPLDAPTRQV